MQQSGLAATRGSDDADELAGMHLKINVVESEKALSRLRAITEANLTEADFGNPCCHRAYRTADGDWPLFARRSAGASRGVTVPRTRKLSGKLLNVGAHGMAFRPFSART